MIRRLKISNFLRLTDVDLEFGEGLYLIQGPNGAGKSTLLEAIAFSLFSRKRGDSFQDYIQIGKSSASVTVSFEYGDREFEVFTEIKKGDSTVSRIAKSPQYPTEWVNSQWVEFSEKIFGESFSNIALVFQKSSSLGTLTPAARRKLFADIFHIDALTGLADSIQEDIKTLEMSYKKLEGELEAVQKALNVEPMPLEPLPFSEEQLKDLEASEKRVQEEIVLLKVRQKNLYSTTNEGELRAIENRLAQAKRSLDQQKEQLKSYESKLEISRKELDQIKEEGFSSRKKLETLQGEYQAFLEKNQELLNVIIDQGEIRKAYETLAKVKAELSRWIEIEKLKDSKCPTCEQEVSQEYVSQKILPHVHKKKTELESIQREVDEILKKKQKAEEVQEKSRKYSQDIRLLEQELANARSRYKSLEQIIKGLEESIASSKDVIEKISSEVSVLEERKIVLAPTEDSRKEAEDLVRQISEKESLLSEIQSKIKTYYQIQAINSERMEINRRQEETKRSLEQQLAEGKDKLYSMEEDIKTLETAKRIISKELPQYILGELCTEVSNVVNWFISQVDNDLKVSIQPSKAGIEVTYQRSYIQTPLDIRMASGGEEELIDVSFRVALAMYHGYPFLLLDEIDSYADTSRSIHVVRALLDLPFRQIFLVTHKAETAENVIARITHKPVTVLRVRDGQVTPVEGLVTTSGGLL